MSKREPDTTAEEPGGEPFLERWSRLKEQARANEPATELRPDATTHGEKPATDAGAPPHEGEHPAVELPDLEQLDQDSDYSAFLTPGVDATLKRRALRKLFSSPKFNVFDGLDTYRDDFTSFPPLGEVVTVDMRHHLERLVRKVAAGADELSSSTPDTAIAAAAPVDAGPDRPAALPPERTDDDADHDPA
jgi:Protein of unknown function (DUF3306)